MRAQATLALLLAAVLAFPAAVKAEGDEPGQLAAVQRRKFRMDHEIFLGGGLQPLDAFYKGLGPVGGYTLHFTDVLGWEVVRGGYSFRLGSGLREQLKKDFGVAPTRFEEMEWYVGTAAMITPFYGKLALLNRAVMHAEMFILVGATLGTFTGQTPTYKPGPQAGLGLRFFLSEWISVRFDFRYHYLIANKPTQVIDIALGLCFNLGGTD